MLLCVGPKRRGVQREMKIDLPPFRKLMTFEKNNSPFVKQVQKPNKWYSP